MPTASSNPLRYLAEQARADLQRLQDELSDAQAQLQTMHRHLFGPGQDLNAFNQAGGFARYNQLQSTVPQLQRLIPIKRGELAELERKAAELDKAAERSIANGTDPNVAYSTELQKLQAKATLITVLKWAGIIGAAILVLLFIRGTFTRIVKA